MPDQNAFRMAGTTSPLRILARTIIILVLLGAAYQSGIWRVAQPRRRATVVLARAPQITAEGVADGGAALAEQQISDGDAAATAAAADADAAADAGAEDDGAAALGGGGGAAAAEAEGGDGGAVDGDEAAQQTDTAQVEEGPPGMSAAEAKARCGSTLGDWCAGYLTQRPVLAKPPPHGNRTCLWGDTGSPGQCNFVGVCDHMKGWCRCPAGWTADDCSTRKRRPCSQKHREGGFEPYDKPANLSEPRQLVAACAGLCDEDIGYCMCDTQYKYGHQFAALDAPPGSPPVKRGRPQGFHCQPKEDEQGNRSFGDSPPETLWGPEGWCQADEPTHQCPCILDGRGGPFCMGYTEMMCPNQCNGHGECNLGFCKCHKGWWGHDCAYRTAGTPWTPGLEETERPWIKEFVHTPASRDPEPGATRKRPLIYVYELPPLYNAWMLQYRPDKGSCVHRVFNDANGTRWVDEWLYAAEPGLHEALLQSEHRTLDPEEADFFYIPVYTSCYIYPIHGFSDSPYFHAAFHINRVFGAVNMLIEVHQWIRTHHPYWERNQGRDHIILQTHDEGSCWLPAVLRNATLLTHWGRTDLGHQSNTGFESDNYTEPNAHPLYMPEGSEGKLGDYPCYNPEKDLVVPAMATPNKYQASPLFGAPAHERTILGFFKGRTQQQVERYSRGIRQFLENTCRDEDWWGKHRITIGEGMPTGLDGSYSKALSSSKFCFVLPGDGWSARLEDSVLHGCLPVIIQDDVMLPFETVLDFSLFALRIPQKDMRRIPEILKAVPEEKVVEMQKALGKVWRRWLYSGYRPYGKIATNFLQVNGAGAPQEDKEREVPQAFQSYPHPESMYDPSQTDALETIFGWLHSRIPHTRGPPRQEGRKAKQKGGVGGRKGGTAEAA